MNLIVKMIKFAFIASMASTSLTAQESMKSNHFFMDLGLSNNRPQQNGKSNALISMPSLVSITPKIGVIAYFRSRFYYSAALGINTFNNKIKVQYRATEHMVNQTSRDKYANATYFTFSNVISYFLINKEYWKLAVGVGPQLFVQSKTGLLTTSTGTLQLRDSLDSYNYNFTSTVKAANHFSLGGVFSLKLIKQKENGRIWGYTMSCESSFTPLRETQVNVLLNGLEYAEYKGLYIGQSIRLGVFYAFKI